MFGKILRQAENVCWAAAAIVVGGTMARWIWPADWTIKSSKKEEEKTPDEKAEEKA